MSAALRTLLEGAVDYAGLFPPAGLPMTEAVANYAAYLASEDAWALGRFVVPATRLSEFAEAASPRWPRGEAASPWRVSALLAGADLPTEVEQVTAFDARYGRSGGIVADGERGGAWIDTIELRCDAPGLPAAVAEVAPRWLDCYLEIPLDRDLASLIPAIADAGLRAKVRTGGVTPDAFPKAARLAEFMVLCAAHRVPFKATAGLHHPVRAEYPLTYEAGAPRGTMFGYLNVFLAAAFVRGGMDAATAALLLDERDTTAIRVGENDVQWRGHSLSTESLRAARTDFVRAFGSCSFTEPVDDARAMGLL